MVYLVSSVALILTAAGFFLLAGGRFQPPGRMQWVLRVVGAVPLLVSGMAHFARTSLFASIIPPALPAHPMLVLLSGACEVAGAIGLFFARTRRAASACLVALMIAVFPANVYIANQTVDGLRMPSVPVRAAMQAVYILVLLISGWGLPASWIPGSSARVHPTSPRKERG
jgi:uncharacterized membrane protein